MVYKQAMVRKKAHASKLNAILTNKPLLVIIFFLILGSSYVYGRSQALVLGTDTYQFPVQETKEDSYITSTPTPTITTSINYETNYKQVISEPTTKAIYQSSPTPSPTQSPRPKPFVYMPSKTSNTIVVPTSNRPANWDAFCKDLASSKQIEFEQNAQNKLRIDYPELFSFEIAKSKYPGRYTSESAPEYDGELMKQWAKDSNNQISLMTSGIKNEGQKLYIKIYSDCLVL